MTFCDFLRHAIDDVIKFRLVNVDFMLQLVLGKNKRKPCVGKPVTLNSEMDFYLRNGRNGDFLYEMELQNSILFII